MRRYIVDLPNIGYAQLAESLDAAYESATPLHFTGVREGFEEALVLLPDVIEKRREFGKKILEFVGVQLDTNQAFLASSTYPNDEKRQTSSKIYVTVSDNDETEQHVIGHS